jgi:hypothetical protein
MKKLLLAILLTIFSTSTLAEWTQVGETAGGEFSINVNLKSIRKKKGIVKMWVLKDYKAPQNNDATPYLSSANQVEYNCNNETTQILAITSFSENLGNGIPTYSGSGRIGLPEPILPDSVDELLWKIACNKK